MIASLLLALVVAGCGGDRSHRSGTTELRSASTPSSALGATPTASSCHHLPLSHPFVFAPSDSVVQLKQEPPSMMWQSIFVRPDGTGLVTSLVGEVIGALQVPFRLSPTQIVALKRLIAATRSPSRRSPVVHHAGYLYLLHILGHPTFSFAGNRPTRYGALTRFLDQVMYVHC